MTIHFQRSVEHLKKMILALSAVVEESVQKSVFAIERLDRDLAKEVYQLDEKIDRMEVEIEEECLKVLALHQPFGRGRRCAMATATATGLGFRVPAPPGLPGGFGQSQPPQGVNLRIAAVQGVPAG